MKFNPWVGHDYSSAVNIFGGRKILIVGESHYDSPENVGTCSPNYTNIVVSNYVSDKKRHSFFTNLATFLTGTGPEVSRVSTRLTWENIAFYNYVPVFVASSARSFESKSFWELGEEAFEEVLRTLSPDLIIVLGLRLWDNTYYRHVEDRARRFDRRDHQPKTLIDGRRIDTINIDHPASTRFSARRVRGEVVENLGDVFGLDEVRYRELPDRHYPSREEGPHKEGS